MNQRFFSSQANTHDRKPVPLAAATPSDVPLYTPDEIAAAFKVVNDARMIDGRVHEADFHFFDGLLEGKVFCDIGANVGQCISSLSGLQGRAKIHAFEINPLLGQALRDNTAKFDLDVAVHDLGTAEHDGEADLYLPIVDDQVAHTLGSLSLEALKDPNIAYHLGYVGAGGVPEIVRLRVAVRNFDALKLAPDFVKIDAEGAEMDVLKGMTETLTTQRPVFMIENSFEAEIRRYMLDFGYLPFTYVHPLRALIMKEPAITDTRISGNSFYLHHARIAEFQANGRIASIQKVIRQMALEQIRPAPGEGAPLDQAPSPLDVAYAYRLILGYEPHYAHFMYHWNAYATLRGLRDTFIAASQESPPTN